MKKNVLIVFMAFAATCAVAQAQTGMKYTEASDLTLTGKMMDTPNPYHRIDTCTYKGFSEGQNFQARCASGLAVLFRTNSTSVSVLPEYGEYRRSLTAPDLAQLGFDLYIKKNGRWLFAGSGVGRQQNDGKPVTLVRDMDGQMKECMLHLPMYSELYSVKIVTDGDADISAMESPFRHRVAIYGSSYTQGACISRPGMSYPLQMMRNTGIQILNFGFGGNCKMQPQFAAVLEDADVDAIIFDCFSNPNAARIEAVTLPFIERMVKAHPDIPLIFIATVYRENRNFSLKNDRYEQAKADAAAKVMEIAVDKYDNVYFVSPDTLTGNDHETSVDGVHPSDMGYTRWARTIEKPVLKILKKYGIK